MKLSCVLTSTNENELYADFIPIFIDTWKKLCPEILIKIIYIGKELPEKFKEYWEYLYLFTPLPWISTAFVAQYIRMLYPALMNVDGGVLITDMDMLPMNSEYYYKNIEDVEDDKFFCYRQVLHEEGCDMIPMCYNVALPNVWSKVFKINSIEDIERRIEEVSSKIEYEDRHAGKGWCTDQHHLFMSVMKENNNQDDNLFVYKNDNETGYKRLDRVDQVSQTLPKQVVDDIKNHKYTDYHINRPMSKFSDLNIKIFSLL